MSEVTLHIIPARDITCPFRVYLAINRNNGFLYVGKESGYVHKRRDLHFAEARRGVERAFSKALREDGFQCFDFVYVYQSNLETDVNEKERELIKQLKTNAVEGGAGYNMTNGSQGGCRWTFEEVRKIALTYSERLAWARGHSPSYYAARYHGWLDRASAHMDRKLQKWTRSRILRAADKHKTMFEFKCKDRKAYDAARQRGMLEEISRQKLRSKATVGTPIMMDDKIFCASLAAAAKASGSNKPNILACIRGQRRTAKSHWFRLATYDEIIAAGHKVDFSDHTPPASATQLREVKIRSLESYPRKSRTNKAMSDIAQTRRRPK